MDSQTTAGADPISRENGVDSSSPHQEQTPPPAASGAAEESYETASESEDSSDEKSPMPPTRVLGENPNSEVKKGGATESSDSGDYRVSESDGLDEEKKEAEEAEVVVSGGGLNRDEVLGDGLCSEVENSAVGEHEKETESVVVNPVVGGEEKTEKVDVSDDNDSSSKEPVENSKPVEDEEINAGLKPASVAEKDDTADNLGSDQNTERVVEDTKPVTVEVNSADEESKAVEEEEKPNADAEEEVGVVDGLGKPEVLEELFSADVAKEDRQGPLDEGGELKALETEKNEAADTSNVSLDLEMIRL